MKVDGIQSTIGVEYKSPKPNFKRQWAEHVSWGAKYYANSHAADFKLFTFPDVQKVFVEIGKKASDSFGLIKERGMKIVSLMGAAIGISNIIPKDTKTEIKELDNLGDGVFETKGIKVDEGAEYRFIIVDKNGEVKTVKDPYAKDQSDINGWSRIYNQDNYEWQSLDWIKGKDSRRIIRKPEQKFGGLEQLVIEEINIPTLSESGNFDDAKAYVEKIASKGVANAIEIMPVENANSLGWSYDGVDKFAVNSKLGGPDKLKEFIDFAHSKGLNVIIDIVPNHMGPDGDYLSETGPYIKGNGNFGHLFNYEGNGNRYVRDFMVNEALWYLNEFKADGLRLDLTFDCDSDWFLKQVVDEVNYHNPDAFLIAEDQRSRDDKVLNKDRFAKYMNHDMQLGIIDDSVDGICHNELNKNYPTQIGFDSNWDYVFMHDLDDIIRRPYDQELWKFDNDMKYSLSRIKYLMSHDEIGNDNGTRLITKVIAEDKTLNLVGKMYGFDDIEKGKKAAHLAQKLLQLYLSDDIYRLSDTGELGRIAQRFEMKPYEYINPRDVENAFLTGMAKQRLTMGTIMTIPGPKMYFQGDDALETAYFKFFRELSSDKYQRQEPQFVENLIKDKGYDTLERVARPTCVVDKSKINNPKYKEGMIKFSQDIVQLMKDHPAISGGDIVATYCDNYNRIHIHHLMKGNEEILVIKNFGCGFNRAYGYGEKFPDGDWKEIFNSDSKEYAGSGEYTNSRWNPISREHQNLNLAPNSFLILKRI